MDKPTHHRTIADLEAKAPPVPPPPGAGVAEIMRHRLKTPQGQALYALRKQTVEPVFGIIKAVMGFRRFSLRGLEKVSTEWTLVCLSYNFKRLFNLIRQAKSSKSPPSPPSTGQISVKSAISALFQPVGRFQRCFGHFISASRNPWRIVFSPTGC